MQPNYKQYVLLLVVISFVIRLLVAASIELGNDEVYYWTYSQMLQWNYFDHPPMVALWIRLSTLNLYLQEDEVFVRLGSLISCAVATLLIFKTVEKVHSAPAGWLAALLYNASIYASIIAGIFIMPDSPQMVFWCACLYLLVKINAAPASWMYWMLFGACAGLCIMSKVHGVFIWFGLLLFIIFHKRDYIKLPQLYTALLITAIIASPILIWNINNHFITYTYHSNRVLVNHFRIKPFGFFREIVGEVLYNNPVVVFLSIAATRWWIKKRPFRSEVLALYFWIGFPMIGILISVALFKDTLPHWSGPAYVSLLPVTAIYCTSLAAQKVVPPQLRWAIALVIFALIAGVFLINFYPGTIGKKRGIELGKNDFTLDMNGWQKAGKSFATIYKEDVEKGIVKKGAAVVCYKWFPAAHEAYYFCHPLGLPMIGLGNINELHQFSFTTKESYQQVTSGPVYCIIPSNEYYDPQEKYGAYFNQIDSVTEIKSYRGNKPSRNFYIYRLSGWKKTGFDKL